MLDGYGLEVALTAANSAAQAWYGYDQVRFLNHRVCSLNPTLTC